MLNEADRGLAWSTISPATIDAAAQIAADIPHSPVDRDNRFGHTVTLQNLLLMWIFEHHGPTGIILDRCCGKNSTVFHQHESSRTALASVDHFSQELRITRHVVFNCGSTRLHLRNTKG